MVKWSDASYLEDQDAWWLAGLHRSVYLRTKPRAHVADFFIRTPLRFDAQGRLAGAG